MDPSSDYYSDLGVGASFLSTHPQHYFNRVDRFLTGSRKDLAEAPSLVLVEDNVAALRKSVALAPLVVLGSAENRQNPLQLIQL